METISNEAVKQNIKTSLSKQVVKYVYNNVVSVITHRVIKKILKFNVLQYIFMKIGIEYKIAIILIIIIV